MAPNIVGTLPRGTDASYERLTRDVAQRKSLHFLRRPFTMRTLAAKVREVLDKPRVKAVSA